MMRYNAFYGVPRSQLYEAPDAVEEGEGGGVLTMRPARVSTGGDGGRRESVCASTDVLGEADLASGEL